MCTTKTNVDVLRGSSSRFVVRRLSRLLFGWLPGVLCPDPHVVELV